MLLSNAPQLVDFILSNIVVHRLKPATEGSLLQTLWQKEPYYSMYPLP